MIGLTIAGAANLLTGYQASDFNHWVHTCILPPRGFVGDYYFQPISRLNFSSDAEASLSISANCCVA